MKFLKIRIVERIFILLIAIVLGVLFDKLYTILKADFEEVPKRLADGSMVNVNEGKVGEKMHRLLTTGFYFEDPADARLASLVINQSFAVRENEMDNIGELNKDEFNVSSADAYRQGGEVFSHNKGRP